jgi:DNA primase
VSEVVLCFDADAAGQKAAERSLDALLQNNLLVRVAEIPAGEDPDSMIRNRGREEFEKLVGSARDFFDWWIEREAGSSDLDSLGAKMQLAQRLAETIGRVQDPLMRGEVANRASARIGVPRTDFERLLAKPSRDRFSVDDDSPQPERVPPPRHDIAMLSLLGLRHEEARQFLLGQDWRQMLSHTPDAEILGRILESDLRPDDPASLNAFMAGLKPGEEALVSGWLLQKMPPNGLEVAQGFWNGLRQAALRRQLQIAEGRMKLPRLTTGEAVTLQKQIVDLKEQLHQLSAFSPARVLDN